MSNSLIKLEKLSRSSYATKLRLDDVKFGLIYDYLDWAYKVIVIALILNVSEISVLMRLISISVHLLI